MTNNIYDYEAAKRLIEDDTNVTINNPLKDAAEIIIQIVLLIAIIYFSIFAISGIVLKTLPLNKQIALENAISSLNFFNFKIVNDEKTNAKLQKLRDDVKRVDNFFPKTSNLKVAIIEHETSNALCFPNGNIYITSKLFESLTDDEMITFVIAHEIAHYKNKDHLMNLRKSLSSAASILFLSIFMSETQVLTNIVDGTFTISDLGYSRQTEAKADVYAGEILRRLYGNKSGGVRALRALKETNEGCIEFLSTHPNIDKRINSLR